MQNECPLFESRGSKPSDEATIGICNIAKGLDIACMGGADHISLQG